VAVATVAIIATDPINLPSIFIVTLPSPFIGGDSPPDEAQNSHLVAVEFLSEFH
jgi:hypothetical protein